MFDWWMGVLRVVGVRGGVPSDEEQSHESFRCYSL